MAPPAVLTKIKLLLKLTESPEPNEAATAQALANKMIEKHGLTQEEVDSLKDPKPLYTEDDKLYWTLNMVSWKQRLALAIATHFDCLIVQEHQVPGEGEEQYHYYVYGNPEDTDNVRYVFYSLSEKVEDLISNHCVMKGPIYIASYGEGPRRNCLHHSKHAVGWNQTAQKSSRCSNPANLIGRTRDSQAQGSQTSSH